MSRNVVTPKSVSFEDALRNLASRLTGHPAAELPRTQEGVVQFMAENVPTPDELAEAITQEALARLDVNKLTEAVTQEVTARLAAAMPSAGETPDTAPQEAHEGPDTSGGTPTPGETVGTNTEAPVADGKPKRGSKPKTQK